MRQMKGERGNDRDFKTSQYENKAGNHWRDTKLEQPPNQLVIIYGTLPNTCQTCSFQRPTQISFGSWTDPKQSKRIQVT